MKTIARIVSAAVASMTIISGGGAVSVRAQSQPPQADAPGVTPAEIQRMFEAVALVRAQDALKLSDDRYLPFLAKFKGLQDVRRRALQEHTRLLRELNRLTNAQSNADEATIKDRLKALQDLDARSEAELHKSYEGIDSVLDVRQQARFRLFEEMMERRKMDLLLKARQSNRPLKRNQ